MSVIAVALLLSGGNAFARPVAVTAGVALREARAAVVALKKDEKRRKFRHHWLNSARRLEQVAEKYPRDDAAPQALLFAGDLLSELWRFSGNSDDASAAVRCYRRMLEGWPKHRLADDVALRVAELLSTRKDQDGLAEARALVQSAVPKANDRQKDLWALSARLSGSAPPKGGSRRPTENGKPRPDGERGAGATPRVASPAASPGDRSSSVADAISRLRRATAVLVTARASPAPSPSGPTAEARDDAQAQARRLPPLRPREDERVEVASVLTHGPDDVDENSASAIAALQERLRDVRVGARILGEAPVDTKVRLKQQAKAERGAEITLAQQLGLKVRRVVIDPGHGGHDTGAIGAQGTYEKDVALAISTKLGQRLEEMGLEVVLTRDDDAFVKLEERSRLANRQRGDLFISIHCNAAANKKLRGVETYSLNVSSNRYATRLAARENASSERGVGDLQYILADLATQANTGESRRLAQRVQRGLVTTLASGFDDVVDLGHKEALFFVLLGAKMPALLVETSFISNPEEEVRLASAAYQGAIADSIARSLAEFLEERSTVARLD
jgi:N-acetylmuramoyl-L-alanine amidase